MARLTAAAARRIALAASGLTAPRPTGPITARHFRKVFRTLGLVQLDSVNVLARAHLLPFFSRLGPFDEVALQRYLYGPRREVFEYWGHAASLVPVELHPALRWRMQESHAWKSVERVGRGKPSLLDSLEEAVVAAGVVTAAELRTAPKESGSWWAWDDTKMGLESLFHAGRVSAIRVGNFERHYVAPDRTIPRPILDTPTPAVEEAHRTLLRRAAKACGVGSEDDLADHYRIKRTTARPILQSMVAAGELELVEVEGWDRPGYLDPAAARPRQAAVARLVSPFDPMVWYRDRALRVFGFDYRIEIYVPEPKRVFGYYVLPFVHGDRFGGRVDLKADRKAGTLRVQSAWVEDGSFPPEVAADLAEELRLLAAWLGLSDVDVRPRGTLADALRSAFG